MESHFEDRHAAGRLLAGALRAYAGRSDLVVLALARGGVPVGYEVAKALGAEFDVLIVRKLGLPHHPELAMGAIASGGAIDLNRNVIAMSGVTQRDIEGVLAQEYRELTRREALYRGARPAARIEGRTVIVVDDGIATGASMRAALKALRTRKPAKSSSPFPLHPSTRENACRMWPTNSSACTVRPISRRSVSFTGTSVRPATTRCAPCWRNSTPPEH